MAQPCGCCPELGGKPLPHLAPLLGRGRALGGLPHGPGGPDLGEGAGRVERHPLPLPLQTALGSAVLNSPWEAVGSQQSFMFTLCQGSNACFGVCGVRAI